MGMFNWFLSRQNKVEKTQEELAEIRRSFASRYNQFRLLIQANTRAHELVAELEEALRGFKPYGMHYIQALCTRISTSIYQMIKHLNELNPESYSELFVVFDDIQNNIQAHIEPKSYVQTRELIVDIHDVGRDQADLCGPKMAMLGEVGNKLNLPISSGFVITTESFHRFMKKSGLIEEIDRQIQGADLDSRESMFQTSSKVMQLIIESSFPDDLAEAILQAYDSLCVTFGMQVKLAVRSSALGEDIEGTAFAGQYRSVLNVGREFLLSACKEVMASKYSQQAMAYRINRGIKDENVAVCVGCMVMVDAHASGVAYSRSPVNIRDENISIHSVWGLPKAVVDGSAETDEFLVSRVPDLHIISRQIAEKTEKYICGVGEGICRMPLIESDRNAPSLTDGQVLCIAMEVLRIEEYFGLPQDVEWAMTEDGQFHLLQCRPLLQVEQDMVLASKNSSLPAPYLSGGRNASPGVGCGSVFIVRKDADILLFPDGAVLVIKQALSSMAPLLGRCSAVISEQGGVAGHLANVAREFGVPALFGVKGAQSHLTNGQTITVDADGRTVYDGLVEALFNKKPRKRIMRGSPVQATLRDAARHIVRLNLTDSDSLNFKPEQCRTLHDIMRFCHEMAVREMFEFGTNDAFAQAASRQLICNVPKQFWVLNLDDGIDPKGEDRADHCVLLEHVNSIPMRAVFKGMDAVPWEGPPPVHPRGLMSVMFEATINPDLNPAGPSRFTQKNYFMVSKNYCSLQSRFGFHFCGVEALVSDRITENYASFQFKGGAANLKRRILRARFVGDILSEFDFKIRVREDNMSARLEGLDQAGMEYRLNILGYLMTHTRQLDMIMTDQVEVERRKTKFFQDFKLFNPKKIEVS